MARLAAMALAAALAAGAALADMAAARADGGAGIRAVIEDQIARFGRDDWDGAFAHAAPGIREIFRTPEGFGRMVREGYPMVWRPSRVEAGEMREGPRGPVQVMRLTDAAGAVHEAEYEMAMVDGAWRIAGVRVVRLPDLSA